MNDLGLDLWKLPLEDWHQIQKFGGLEHFNIGEELAPAITDEHIKILSQLKLPKLRQVSLAHCRNVTDNGIESLTNIPSIQGLRLIGTGITDRGLRTLATEFTCLSEINIEQL